VEQGWSGYAYFLVIFEDFQKFWSKKWSFEI